MVKIVKKFNLQGGALCWQQINSSKRTAFAVSGLPLL
jgi:hypothetical protein